jgi:hypothetical protein
MGELYVSFLALSFFVVCHAITITDLCSYVYDVQVSVVCLSPRFLPSSLFFGRNLALEGLKAGWYTTYQQVRTSDIFSHNEYKATDCHYNRPGQNTVNGQRKIS